MIWLHILQQLTLKKITSVKFVTVAEEYPISSEKATKILFLPTTHL